jgi:hypothetical protein
MYLLSITNKMQRYTIFFITVNAVYVSGSFSAHHQELRTVHTALGICQACFTYTGCCVYSFELLMMGGETAWNMYNIDSNKEYCLRLHLVGILDRICYCRCVKIWHKYKSSSSPGHMLSISEYTPASDVNGTHRLGFKKCVVTLRS